MHRVERLKLHESQRANLLNMQRLLQEMGWKTQNLHYPFSEIFEILKISFHQNKRHVHCESKPFCRLTLSILVFEL